MIANNGQIQALDDPSDGGAIGGDTLAPQRHCYARGSITLLIQQLGRTDKFIASEWEKVIDFACRVRDDEEASVRDRIRATQLLTMLIEKGLDLAVAATKESPKTEVNITQNVVHMIPAPTRARVGD